MPWLISWNTAPHLPPQHHPLFFFRVYLWLKTIICEILYLCEYLMTEAYPFIFPVPESQPHHSQSPGPRREELTPLDMNLNAPNRDDVVYLKREKQPSPSLHAQKHPHGATPPTPTHPHSAGTRSKTYGNDNSSVNRQTRCQSTRPDPVPGMLVSFVSS